MMTITYVADFAMRMDDAVCLFWCQIFNWSLVAHVDISTPDILYKAMPSRLAYTDCRMWYAMFGEVSVLKRFGIFVGVVDLVRLLHQKSFT